MNTVFAFPNSLGVLPGLLTAIPTGGLMSILSYVFTALGLYTMAEHRGIKHGWMAWVPVLNVWILGSLSDQYRYVVRGEIRNKRKLLLILRAASALLSAVIFGVCAWMVSYLVLSGMSGAPEYRILQQLTNPIVAVCGLSAPLLCVKIAELIFRYMALYDVYLSCDPENAVMFLVLSIFVRVTKAFFLFFNREKEKGMPPRKQAVQPDPEDNSVYGVIQ